MHRYPKILHPFPPRIPLPDFQWGAPARKPSSISPPHLGHFLSLISYLPALYLLPFIAYNFCLPNQTNFWLVGLVGWIKLYPNRHHQPTFSQSYAGFCRVVLRESVCRTLLSLPQAANGNLNRFRTKLRLVLYGNEPVF